MTAIIGVLNLYEASNKRRYFDSIINCFNVSATVENEKDKKEE